MKLTTFRVAEEIDWGVVMDEQILRVGKASALLAQINTNKEHVFGNPSPMSVKEWLAIPDGIDRLRRLTSYVTADMELFRAEGALISRDQVELLPPIPNPGKFLCVGKNYRTHLDELFATGLIKEMPREPTAFIKLAEVLVGQNAEVVRPAGITTLDYEPELVFVIGQGGFAIAPENALSHVAGVMVLNDLTAREIQKREVESGTRFWTAKNMPGFGPIGPVLTTIDEIGDPHDLWITLSVNGHQRIRVHTGDQIFKLPDILAHFSQYIPLRAGDMFSTGSPGGVAVGQPNASELYLRPDDIVEVGIEGLEPLRTRIVGDQPSASQQT